jgi:NAD(P)-dependent dehydrogenase (short-subunit alcohol dehydrogenase family)
MGLGLEAARVCLSYGADVLLCARGAATLQQAGAELSSAHPERRIATQAGDVGNEADVARIFEAMTAQLGGCDALIHAAAVLGPIGNIREIDDATAWSDALRINLFGTFLVARGAARSMKSGGRIVLFSGGGAASAFPNYTAYACSKAAVVRFTETIAQELAPDIEVNALAPGFVATRMHQQTLAAGARAGEEFFEKTRAMIDEAAGVSPTVAAEACAFLVSDAARGISGKLVAAVHDNYREWPLHLAELRDGDLFTLRRIVPRDRGLDWQ